MIKYLQSIILSATFFFTFNSSAQTFNFTSGPIPMCDTSIFTANVSGVGQLAYNIWSGGYFLDNICINITTNHPQTLVITLTSPQGTNLLLSAFNGAGGSNYTNTCFTDNSWLSITAGTAPFTGSWFPQGGNNINSTFYGEWGSGTWTLTIIDTACTGGSGTGGTWTPGYFTSGGTSGSGISFGYSAPPPPPCWGSIPDYNIDICLGDTVDILSYYSGTGYVIDVYNPNFQLITNPNSVTSAGSYHIEAYDWSSGCTYSAFFTINTLPQAALGPDQNITVCSSSILNLNNLFNLSGFTSTWTHNGTAITNSDASNANAPGQYQIIASNPAGCNDTAVVNLTQMPGVSIGTDQIITSCGPDTLDLTSLYNTTGLTANWTLNGSTVSNPTSVTASGTYILIASDISGCSDTVQVIYNSILAPNLGPDLVVDFCIGSEVDLTTLYNTGSFSTSWTFNGNVIANPGMVNSPGIYMLIAGGSSGCADSALVTLNSNPAPVLGPDQSLNICSNSPVDLSLLYNTTGYITSWSLNGNVIANPNNINSSGNYVLVATESNGCTDTAQVIINASPAPALGPDQSVSFCDASVFDLTALFNTGSSSTSWILNGTIVTNPVAVSNSGNYTLIATNASGCSDTAEVNLASLSTPVLGPNQTLSICSNDPLDLTGLFITTGYTTSWTMNGTLVANPNSVNSSGNYVLIATEPNGCSDTAEVAVSSSQAPTLGSDQTIDICLGDSVNLDSLFNTSGLLTEWSNNGIQVNNPSIVTSAGNYQLIATNSTGCSDTASVILNVNSVPILGPDQNIDVCDNVVLDLTTLYNTSGYTSNWTTAGVPVSNPNSILNSGIYTLTAINSQGCSNSANVNANFISAPILGTDVTVEICDGNSIDLNSHFPISGLTSFWTTNGLAVPDPSIINTSGIYQLIAVNVDGCSDTSELNLTINVLPVLGASQSFELCPWMTIDLSSIYNTQGFVANYIFNNQQLINYNAVSDSGVYTVEVTDNNGCSSSASINISNIYCECNADFEYSGYCLQEPYSFEIISDSVINSAHWQFGAPDIPDQYIINPSVKFLKNNAENIIVTLDVTLSCGTLRLQKILDVVDCEENCPVFLPASFTPNKDGLNDLFGWYSECLPEFFDLQIYNRLGEIIFNTMNPFILWDGYNNNSEVPNGLYIVKLTYKMPHQDKKQLLHQLWVVR